MGNRSRLKEYMGGYLHAPCNIARLIRKRAWTEAQLATEQACKLTLMSLTHYRDDFRRDLRPLMPDGMDVSLRRSLLQTLLAHAPRQDMVPLQDTLVEHIRATRSDLSLESVALLRSLEDGASTARIKEAMPRPAPPAPGPDRTTVPVVQRLVARVDGSSSSAPSAGRASRRRGCACAAGAATTCDACFRATSRCALLPTTQQAPPLEEEKEQYPVVPTFTGSTVREDLEAHTPANGTQVSNTVNTLHALMHHGFKRPLLVIETYPGQTRDPFNTRELSRCTGYRVERVDNVLAGKGTAVARIQAAFDDLTKPPMAMVCFGMDVRLLVGTDLGNADAIVCVGDISSHFLTQSLGRVFRPVVGRKRRRPVQMIKVYASRRRVEEEDNDDE